MKLATQCWKSSMASLTIASLEIPGFDIVQMHLTKSILVNKAFPQEDDL